MSNIYNEIGVMMEIEVRFYYSIDSKNKIIEYLNKFNELEYMGRFYEKTDQYNHPMKEYNFYNLDIDGRFRIRRTINDDTSKAMITWKRRLKEHANDLIHSEEEVEVTIQDNEYDNLIFLINNVLHMDLVESYERYRNIFKNDDVEIVVDEYPFGIAVEIESKSKEKDGEEVIKYWLNKLKLDINKSYSLSWDDKYSDLCKEQNKEVSNIVRFNEDMPRVLDEFEL